MKMKIKIKKLDDFGPIGLSIFFNFYFFFSKKIQMLTKDFKFLCIFV